MPQTTNKRKFSGIYSLAWLLVLTPGANSANLSLSDQVFNAGEIATIPMTFSAGGQGISGVQFDIHWDPALTVRVETAGIIGQSSKSLFSASLGPQSLRCLIVGVSKTLLNEGNLLSLFITANSGQGAGTGQLTLTNAVATDPDGGMVPLDASTATITFLGGPVTRTLSLEGVVNAASLLPGSVAPGEVLTLLGSFSAPTATVLFNGVPGPVTYSGPGQINAIVPFGLDLSLPAALKIQTRSHKIAELSLSVSATAPAIFTQTGSGTGPGLVFNQDCTPNSPSNPAAPGSTLIIYGTGFGQVRPEAIDGQIQLQQAATILPVSAAISGIPADVTYAGASPGSVAGIFVINVRTPSLPYSSPFAPITLTIGPGETQPGVTVSLR